MSSAPAPLPQSYFAAGQSWEHGTYMHARASARRAWIVAICAVCLAVFCLISAMLIMPLKTIVPYVVTVDRLTGHTELTQELAPGTLSQEQAMTEYYLVRYVENRERYNPHILKENYETVAMLSDAKALREFEELWSGDNPDNPSRLLGKSGVIDVHVKSLSMINDNTAQLRFVTRTRKNQNITESHWVALVTYRFTNEPLKVYERYKNPLGFQVISYRKSQEILEKTP